MNKWKLIAPVGLIAAVAAAAVLLKKDTKSDAPKSEAKPAAKKNADPQNAGVGTYTFVSGYKDAAACRVNVKYDADAFSFAVVSEEFLVYSGDSHVALLTGEDYNVQLEYAPYYSGEGFNELCGHIKEKYSTFSALKVSGLDAIRYIEGDAVVTCIGADEYSYIIISAMKAKDSKIELPDIVDDAPLAYMLGNIEIGKE